VVRGREMKVSVDLERCCGHGRCYALCPEIFEEDDDGHAVLTRVDVPVALESRVRAAVNNCPERAIELDR
jgi:ferredoxin